MNKNISTAFAVTVIMLVAAFAVFILWEESRDMEEYAGSIQNSESTNESNTSGWKIYQNKSFGYEIKYPADWKILTLGNVPAETFSAPTFQSPECYSKESGICSSFEVGSIHKVEAGETIESGIPLGAGSNFRIIENKLMKIGGENVNFVEFYQAGYGRRNGEIGKVRQQIKMIHDGNAYVISLDEENDSIKILDSSKYWKNKAVLEAMAETFRFADAKENMVGNDKDEHGCIGSAGYSWCEAKQKCLRTWEEKCGK